MKRTALFALVEACVRRGPFRSASSAGRASASALAVHWLAMCLSFGQSPDAAPAAAGPLPVLTNVHQVLQLGRAGARQHSHPVNFEAVTTEPVVAQPTWLWVQDDGTVFEVLCELRGTNTLPATHRNAVVEASGICTVQPLASGEMRTLRLWLREPADLRVLGQAAPWESLMPGRILAVSGGLGALALAWIAVLRRQVAQRRQAEEKARRSEATTRTINYFATSLLERHNEDEILWDLAKNCVSQLGFVDCVIYLLDRDQKILVQKAAFGTKIMYEREKNCKRNQSKRDYESLERLPDQQLGPGTKDPPSGWK